jgi:O-antigen/teichoic acid export membrane protein
VYPEEVVKRLSQLVRTLRGSEFLRHNAVFFVGSLAVSALNYLYYPVLGRLMDTSDFGETQTLVSLFLQATIFLSVVTNVAVNIVANERDAELRNRIIYELEHAATLITLAVLGLMLVFIPQLKSFLQFEHAGPFLVLGLALLVSVPGALRNAYLRGRSAFGQISIAGAVGSLAKIIFSAGFVLLGWRTLGAMGGLVAAQLLAMAYAAWQAHRHGLHRPATAKKLWRRPDIALIRPHLPYAGLVLVVSLVSTTLFSFDIIAVKHYFPAVIAGQYAGISTIARIIYFLTGSVSAVLLSSIKLGASPATNRRLLLRSAMLQGAIGGAALLVFVLAPRLVVETLIGSKYAQFISLLPRLSFALFAMAFISLLFSYDLALRRPSAAIIAIFGAIIMATIVIMHHATPGAVVDSLLCGSLAILAVRALDSVRRLMRNSIKPYAKSRTH